MFSPSVLLGRHTEEDGGEINSSVPLHQPGIQLDSAVDQRPEALTRVQDLVLFLRKTKWVEVETKTKCFLSEEMDGRQGVEDQRKSLNMRNSWNLNNQ